MDVKILEAVHAYWFGDLKAWDDQPPEDRRKAWFRSTPEIDAYIRDMFASHISAARDTAWDVPALTRPQQVGLIVLLDQFPRQIHRESGEAFACDPAARAIARQMIVHWRRYFIVEQTFVLLPFEHSEDAADQDLSVMLFAERAVEVPEAFRAGARETLDYATRHRDVIRRFGRFPHRNVMLGRQSTAEEIEFLKDGRGF